MAISPKSKGLGNIGSIVNRQRLASPTKPVAPVAKPVTKAVARPVAPKVMPKQAPKAQIAKTVKPNPFTAKKPAAPAKQTPAIVPEQGQAPAPVKTPGMDSAPIQGQQRNPITGATVPKQPGAGPAPVGKTNPMVPAEQGPAPFDFRSKAPAFYTNEAGEEISWDQVQQLAKERGVDPYSFINPAYAEYSRNLDKFNQEQEKSFNDWYNQNKSQFGGQDFNRYGGYNYDPENPTEPYWMHGIDWDTGSASGRGGEIYAVNDQGQPTFYKPNGDNSYTDMRTGQRVYQDWTGVNMTGIGRSPEGKWKPLEPGQAVPKTTPNYNFDDMFGYGGGQQGPGQDLFNKMQNTSPATQSFENIMRDKMAQVPPGEDPMSYLGFQGPMGGGQQGPNNPFKMGDVMRMGGTQAEFDQLDRYNQANPLTGAFTDKNQYNGGGFMSGNSSGSLFGGGGFAGK